MPIEWRMNTDTHVPIWTFWNEFLFFSGCYDCNNRTQTVNWYSSNDSLRLLYIGRFDLTISNFIFCSFCFRMINVSANELYVLHKLKHRHEDTHTHTARHVHLHHRKWKSESESECDAIMRVCAYHVQATTQLRTTWNTRKITHNVIRICLEQNCTSRTLGRNFL